MAGWKLRKDKASAETPGTDPDSASASDFTSASDSASAVETHDISEATFLDTVPGLPDFDSDAGANFDGLHSHVPGHAEGSGPLTLVDYTEPVSQEANAHVYDAPSYDDTAVIAMPPPEPAVAEHDAGFEPATKFEPEAEFEPATKFESEAEFEPEMEPVSASSSWLSSDFSAETPTVAPFVLDAPAPAAPPAAPQIVVRIGRLSAPFNLTKDVTAIGRPDSALSYYPDVEIEMDDAVSRRHCEIVRREGGYFLVDTGSTNGTRLNGETLISHQEHLLAHGDRIHLGDRTEITFE